MAAGTIETLVGSQRPIAIVDDNSDDLFQLQHELKFLFGETPVLSFSNGLALLNYLQHPLSEKERPALILLDLHMDKVNGLRTLEFLRAHGTLADIPVVIVSGTKDTRDMLATYRSGAKGFLHKPLVRGELIKALRGRPQQIETRF
ncbi:MAG: response regulator [Alphaproteobacteria bacterium]